MVCAPPQVPRYFLHRIPRSREVRQSWLSTVATTLHSACLSLPLTYRVRPDLVCTLLSPPAVRLPARCWPVRTRTAEAGRALRVQPPVNSTCTLPPGPWR